MGFRIYFKVLSNGVGPIILFPMAWKRQRSKDNYADQQITTTTYFYQKTSNFNKILFSQQNFLIFAAM